MPDKPTLATPPHYSHAKLQYSIMKIILLTTDYLPNIGGVAQHIYELARALALAGNAVEVIAPAQSVNPLALIRPPYSETSGDFKVWRIPTCLNRSIRFVSGQITGRLSRRRFARLAIERFVQAKPDLLHWHALDVRGYPAETFDGPRVWTNHTSNFIDGMATSHGRAHYQREASAANQIICPSEELANLTIQLGIPRENVHFIPNGVDTTRFHPTVDSEPWRQKLNLKSTDRLILCPRRLEKKNGVRYFIEAAIQLLNAGLSHSIFAVAGNYVGPKSDSDEELVATLIQKSGFASAFHLLGRVENIQIPGLYAAADLVVMPSLIEATSLSAMEAMATGKALVSTNVGGLPFLIRHEENGFLVPPRDAPALANRISLLLDNPSLREQFGAAGRKRAESELDWKVVAAETCKIYNYAIER